jgi:CBS domain-containing protein
MTMTARDIMTQGPACIGEHDTLLQAARKMRDLDVGALPICGEDDRLKGMLTDRDIVIRCLAEDRDPGSVTAGSLAEGAPVTIGADDPLEEVLATMAEYQVRRLPVIDGERLVGIIAESDIAQNAPAQDVAETIDAVTEG